MYADFDDPLARPKADPVSIILTPDELMLSFAIAFSRNTVGRSLKNFSMRYGDDFGLHVQGAQAELAVAVYLGLKIDRDEIMAWNSTASSVRSADVEINGWAIEVKAVRFYPPMLKFFPHQRFDKDFAVLCYSRGGVAVDIYAAISRIRFAAISVPRKSKLEEHVLCPSVYVGQMTPIEEFRDWITTHRPDPHDRRKGIRIEKEETCESLTSLKAEASLEASVSLPNTSIDSPTEATTPSSS